MRKVTYGVACSLDGYIARPGGGVDWLHWTDDVQRITTDFWKTVDTAVMGRRTYEVALAAGMPAYPGVRNLVLSSSLPAERHPRVEVIAADAVAFMARLKAEEGSGIALIGGGTLAASLLAAGLIDEVGVNVHPVILGEGVPLFAAGTGATLELISSERIQGGCVYSLYRVVGKG